MKWCILLASLFLVGCQTVDTGAQAVRMEQQDDAACRGRQDYRQCRSNLMVYRRQAAIENQQRQARLDAAADALGAAGRAMQGPQSVDVNVTCTFGCR